MTELFHVPLDEARKHFPNSNNWNFTHADDYGAFYDEWAKSGDGLFHPTGEHFYRRYCDLVGRPGDTAKYKVTDTGTLHIGGPYGLFIERVLADIANF